MNLVGVRAKGGEDRNQNLIDGLNDAGDRFLAHTQLGDRLTMGLSIAQTSTALEHVERAWAAIRGTATELA